ncbi:hypothetical protein EJB05_26552, partial [Eragrostis curvula]
MTSSCAVSRGAPAQSASTIVADAVEGSHVLKIEGYSRTKGLSNGKYIDSSTFDVGGHAWYIRYYTDGGIEKNVGWISLFLGIQCDNATEVVASFKFSLLDDAGEPVLLSLEQDAHLQGNRPCWYSWGYTRFIQNKALEESTYLSKDFQSQFVDVPPSNLHCNLGCLLSSKLGADVTFEVAGETFPAHRYILAARSSLFGSMKEKTMTCIQIDDVEARTNQLLDIEKSDMLVMAQHLLVVADRYDLERLKLICEDKLCNFIDTRTVATTLTLAEQHGCHGLKQAFYPQKKKNSSNNLKTTMASDGFDHLMTCCPSLIKELLAK